MPAQLRRGSRGEAVRDLQQRLAALGHDLAPDELGELGDGTESAVRAFQDARGLRVDGVVERETWSALVESGFSLGDRLLYFRRPLLRGDDVTDLQRRLNALGFDAGREDGMLGADTHRALMEFQRSAGLASDGICGSTTIAALDRVGSFAEGSVAAVRERELLRVAAARLAERKVYVAATPNLAALGEAVARGLIDAGADSVLDTTGGDDSLVVSAANRFGADLFLALRTGDATGARCTYFESGRFRSEAGFAVASAITEQLGRVLPGDADTAGKAYAALRETTMPAVVCELLHDGDVAAMSVLVSHAGDAARAIVRGIQNGIERPALDPD